MKQYKFEIMRSGNLVSSLTEMESFVNKYAKKGWDLKSIRISQICRRTSSYSPKQFKEL